MAEEKKEKVQAEAAAKEAVEEKAAQAEEKAEAAPAEEKAEAAPAEEKAEEAKPKVELSENLENIVKSVEQMTVLELSELVKALEDKFGVSAAAPMAVAAMPGAGAGAAGGADEEEKSVFSVVLSDVGSNKIQVIKEIRAVTSLGLKEAKDLVDSAPKEIKADVPKEEAEKIKKQLEESGAKIELK